MYLKKYTPDLYNNLRDMCKQLEGEISLIHRPFVDYYYAGNSWCSLYLLLNDNGKVLGTIGIERMPFLYGTRNLILGFGTNFFALEKGVGYGRKLFTKWMECCHFGLAFGSSQEAHRIYRKQKWVYYGGIQVYFLNEVPTPYQGEAFWRIGAKWLLRRVPRMSIERRLSNFSKEIPVGLSVREENAYTEDMLPDASPFRFRFAPSIEYLAWRYSTEIPFARYRVFRILKPGEGSSGYVILNQTKSRVIVAQCDGTDARTIAFAVLLSLQEIAKDGNNAPEVMLSSSHPQMQEIYRTFGFKASQVNRAFAIGSLKRSPGITSDTANWLVNFDWGDNGLRTPFLDQ